MNYKESDSLQSEEEIVESSEAGEIGYELTKSRKTAASSYVLLQKSTSHIDFSAVFNGQYKKLYTDALGKISNTSTQKGFKKTIKHDVLFLFIIVWQQCLGTLNHLERSLLDAFFSNLFYASYSNWPCVDIDSCINNIQREYLTFKSEASFSNRRLIYFEEESCVCLLLSPKFDSYGSYVLIKEQSCGINMRDMDNVSLQHKSKELLMFVGSFCNEFLEYIGS